MKPRIELRIWNIKKQKTSNQHSKKKNEFKKIECKEPLGQLQACQHLHHGVPEGEDKEEEFGNLFEKLMKENFPNLVNYTSPGSTENLKHDGDKETHYNTHDT